MRLLMVTVLVIFIALAFVAVLSFPGDQGCDDPWVRELQCDEAGT
jgi:hypothetical protein